MTVLMYNVKVLQNNELHMKTCCETLQMKLNSISDLHDEIVQIEM